MADAGTGNVHDVQEYKGHREVPGSDAEHFGLPSEVPHHSPQRHLHQMSAMRQHLID